MQKAGGIVKAENRQGAPLAGTMQVMVFDELRQKLHDSAVILTVAQLVVQKVGPS